MKKAFKVIIIIVLAIVLAIGGFLTLLLGSFERVKTDISKYSEDISEIGNAAKFMPDLETLNGYTDIEYTYKIKCSSIFMGFFSDGYALFVTYDKERYEAQKDEVMSNYTFVQKPILGFGNTNYTIPIAEFQYNGYDMKVVPDEEYIDFSACKSFMLLGFNDEECKIAYLYHYDFDLDYIAEVGEDLEDEMIEFMDDVFAWPK